MASKKGHLFIEHVIADIQKDAVTGRYIDMTEYTKRFTSFIKRITHD